MDFIAKYALYGILFAGPVDRPLFPVQVETEYTPVTLQDAAERWELVGADRIIIRSGRLENGAFVEDSGEVSGTNLMLDADGYIRSKCADRNCDYRRNGWEYIREAGRYVRIRAWSGGAVQKTWEITHQDGRLISASEGMLQVSWFGNEITRQSYMMREEPPPLFHVLTYAYDSSLTDPASDTVQVESRNPFFEPQEALQIYRLRDGRLTSRVEWDMATDSRYSETLYRYQATVSLPAIARRRVAPRVDAAPAVDALGRLLPGRPGPAVRAWPAGMDGVDAK
jgi:hypothetical protein